MSLALVTALITRGVQVEDLDACIRHVGRREINPVVASVSGNFVAVSTLKDASTIGTIYCVDRSWRRHRVVAVVLMAGFNGGVGAVPAHNARVARRARSYTGGAR